MLDLSRATTVDFETFPIESRPSYPPKAVGVAIRGPNGVSKYFSWAHPHGGNNSTLAELKKELASIARGTGPVPRAMLASSFLTSASVLLFPPCGCAHAKYLLTPFGPRIATPTALGG